MPEAVEPAGILLYKSFSYIGSYPSCVTSGPLPLSFDAFLTAFVILTGKMDNENQKVFQDLFFESLAVLPQPARITDEPAINQQGSVSHQEETKKKEKEQKHKSGLSLEDLGVSFDDMDFNSINVEGDEEEDDDGSKISQRDLTALFTFLLWIVEMEKKEGLLAAGDIPVDYDEKKDPDLQSLKSVAEALVTSMSSSLGQRETENKKDQDQELPCISHRQFRIWTKRNAPNLFKTIQSFVYSKFAMHVQASVTTASSSISDLILQQDTVPVPDVSDILGVIRCTLLYWCLPEKVLQLKQWTRLYSGSQDGFSMNRFENHVFKYPGPTLLVVQGDILPSSSSTSSSQQQSNVSSVVVGAYIPEAWKHSRQYWGSDECFMFELYPTFEVFKPTKRNNQYIYYHNNFGLAFGGTSRSSQPPNVKKKKPIFEFMFTMDNTLQTGTYTQEHYPASPTFTGSALRQEFQYSFETVNVEVFGLGTEKARLAQQRAWDFEKREATRRAGLQLRQSDGRTVDRELLRMAGIIDDDNRQER